MNLMVVKLLSLSLLVALLSSCASVNNHVLPKIEKATVRKLLITELARVDPPETKPIVAVYAGAFVDDTGQRRSNSEYASFSTAVTQNPAAYLIRALHHAGSEKQGFFDVVDRVGLDHLAKERQIIRSARDDFKETQKLKPLLFAGLLMQGSVVGYESNIVSGGVGARYLGIGASKSYRKDTLSVSLRTISVLTGRVLLEVLVTKTILSVGYNQDVFKFVYEGTELIEIENGSVQNESINIALQAAIETAVLQTINDGLVKEFWHVKVD
jgi:curli production assembly/transport component CsgG